MLAVNRRDATCRRSTDLIIVADVRNVIHFQIFDADGKRVVNTDAEPDFLDKAPQIAKLKSLLSNLWVVPRLSQSDKDRVITAVRSIVGHTPKNP